MRFKEQPARPTKPYRRARQLGHSTTTTARGGAKWVARHCAWVIAENHRRALPETFFITLLFQHIHPHRCHSRSSRRDAQNHLYRYRPHGNFIHDIAHLTRAYELRLFHVKSQRRFSPSLPLKSVPARQKRRELNTSTTSATGCAAGFVDVSDHFYAKCSAWFSEDFHPFFPCPAHGKKVNRGTVGFYQKRP